MTHETIARRCGCCGSAELRVRGAPAGSRVLCGECGELLGSLSEQLSDALPPGTARSGGIQAAPAGLSADPLRTLT